MEIWKDIDGFDNYEVSTFGNVRNKKTGRILDGTITKQGYLQVDLYYCNGHKFKRIHTLVAEAFIPNLDNKPQVDHKDGNKINNNIKNLRWATSSENNYNKEQTKNAKYICERNNKSGFIVCVSINKKVIHKHARTMEEAEKIRDELLEQRNKEMAGLEEFIYPSSV